MSQMVKLWPGKIVFGDVRLSWVWFGSERLGEYEMKNQEVEDRERKLQDEMNKLCLKEGYLEHIRNFKIVAVGWLDISEPFEKGEVSAIFLSKLRLLWNDGPILSTLGFHECTLCENKVRSSCEKILIDKENKVEYIFPEMIFHYIEDHKFKPMNEFIEFVRRTN